MGTTAAQCCGVLCSLWENRDKKYSWSCPKYLPTLQRSSVFCPDLGKNRQWQFSHLFTDKRAMKGIKVFGLKAMTDPCLSKGQSLALEVSVFLHWVESETPLESFSAIRNTRVISKRYGAVGGVEWMTKKFRTAHINQTDFLFVKIAVV